MWKHDENTAELMKGVRKPHQLATKASGQKIVQGGSEISKELKMLLFQNDLLCYELYPHYPWEAGKHTTKPVDCRQACAPIQLRYRQTQWELNGALTKAGL